MEELNRCNRSWVAGTASTPTYVFPSMLGTWNIMLETTAMTGTPTNSNAEYQQKEEEDEDDEEEQQEEEEKP